ncbi:hypothetical protein ACEWY4_018216 [Coilia grayii]|uniref:Gypsy retrotransposon integrase-like protein 1 n=1 Tax=Coilia grayii TaxID=363190 RepID=A0ABD1JJ12_9TELE
MTVPLTSSLAPLPDNRKRLQQFLGFANFYRRFIQNYSSVAAPLTALTSVKKAFVWTPTAEVAFTALKDRFTSAPILLVPDPDRQLIVEVDASDVGVGAVLSQRSAEDNKLHPCAFFSRRLSPAEQNYDIGDRELLAVKLALKEWRHWLEGASVPFLVWTDHRNLQYIRSAKRLNPRQSRWSLFFARFNFTLSYRPGSRNTKPDALSRQFQKEDDSPQGPASIIPGSRVIAAVTWDIEGRVQRALQAQPGPSACPDGRLFVPEPLRSQVLQWGHDSRIACHPGAARSGRLIAQRFWWPTMEKDTREYVQACLVCNQNKSSNQPPAGLLQPLPVPSRPWSHIALDFVTGLPASGGMTTILTIVDRFSKMAHFIPLPKLPTAKETAQAVQHHVFRIHGIPKDIVSDRGPQFTSTFWKEFCHLLGATVLHLGSTPSRTARRNVSTRSWRRRSAVWSPVTPSPGLSFYYGLNMLTIHLPALPLACLPSSVSTVINLRCSPARRGRHPARQPLRTPGVVDALGLEPELHYSGLSRLTPSEPTVGEPLQRSTGLVKKSGFPPGTSLSGWSLASWLLGSWDLSSLND